MIEYPVASFVVNPEQRVSQKSIADEKRHV